MAGHSSTCAVCGKSFQNKASVKRHERYCRKRLTNPAPPRRKSCLACIHAKSRCDSRTPGCGPCQRKGRTSVYSSESLSSGEERSVHSATRSSPEKQCPDVPIAIREGSQGTCMNLSMFDMSEASLLSTVPGLSTNLSSEPGDLKSAEHVAASRAALGKSDMPAIRGDLEMPCTLPSRLLRPKYRQSAKTVLVTKLVSQVLYSFPERKINAASCPPFIHHSTFLRSLNILPSDDPIVICQVICRKFSARKEILSDDFSLWDAIAAEQERIYTQRASFDKWLHLSSAQAITIYLLMLAAEGESVLTHHPSLPITLLFTLGTNFEQLNQIHPGFVAANEQSGGTPTWEDWIFAESKLRTATLYFILALYFDVDFGLPCDREGDYRFEDVELPAAKTLWEAKDELSWREEFDMTVPTNEARLKYLDLMRLNKRNSGYEDSDAQKDESRLANRIEKWQKEMDEFGMLVALCGTMV